MNHTTQNIAIFCSQLIEIFGIVLITFFVFYGLISFVVKVLNKQKMDSNIEYARKFLGKGILLGLELFIAADIINSVIVDLTLSSIVILSAIIIIRTFLSFTLNVEITGHWPWQEQNNNP